MDNVSHLFLTKGLRLHVVIIKSGSVKITRPRAMYALEVKRTSSVTP